MRPAACQKTSLWETDSPDTGEVALAPEGERWPEGPKGRREKASPLPETFVPA